MFNLKSIGIIILAAGRGKRLGCVDIPKVMHELNGNPIVSYILAELQKGGILKNKICLVVGFQQEKVKEYFGDKYIYAEQKELLGTAHAAYTGEKALPSEVTDFLILNGDDSAFYTMETLQKFIDSHVMNGNDVTLLTCEREDPQGLGRVIRDENGLVRTIREKENSLPGDETIKEISTGTFCFHREWFKSVYPGLEPIPGLGEYGLPSFVKEALRNKARFEARKLENPGEWFGINTPEQLSQAGVLKSGTSNYSWRKTKYEQSTEL